MNKVTVLLIVSSINIITTIYYYFQKEKERKETEEKEIIKQLNYLQKQLQLIQEKIIKIENDIKSLDLNTIKTKITNEQNYINLLKNFEDILLEIQQLKNI